MTLIGFAYLSSHDLKILDLLAVERHLRNFIYYYIQFFFFLESKDALCNPYQADDNSSIDTDDDETDDDAGDDFLKSWIVLF